MAKLKSLSDDDVYDRLVAAYEAMDQRPGATVPGETAIQTAKRALKILQFALLAANEKGFARLEGVTPFQVMVPLPVEVLGALDQLALSQGTPGKDHGDLAAQILVSWLKAEDYLE